MKFITFITLIIVNCIIVLASPAWQRIVIDMPDLKNSFRDGISYPEDFSIAAKLHVEPDCIKTITASAASLLDQLYEKSCTLITYDGGAISKDYKFNCCGESTWIRVNNEDWYDLKSQGKVDGLRFQQTHNQDNGRYIEFFKVVDQSSQSISSEEFLTQK